MSALSKYKGAIKLFAIGDSLGWITEFEKNSESIRKKYGVDLVSNFLDWSKKEGGRFYGYTDYIQKGSYSDDTQLMLSVARCLKSNSSVDNEYFGKVELANWIHYARGGGRTVKNAAKKIQRKSFNWDSNFFTYQIKKETVDYREMGANGAAMRILPIALGNFADENKIMKEVFRNSIITHGHARAIIGAMLYGYTVNKILRYTSSNFSPLDVITEIGQKFDEASELQSIIDNDINAWIRQWNNDTTTTFEKHYSETLQEIKELLRIVYKSLRDKQSLKSTADLMGCFRKETKGAGTSTVVFAIYLACKYYDSPKDGIIDTVNLIGIDTDTIAAMMGGLLGALHGQHIIPDKWKKVQDHEYLDNVSEQVYKNSISDQPTKEKYSNSNQLMDYNDLTVDNIKQNEKIFFKPLGDGKIILVRGKNTLAKNKTNIIFEVCFDVGQSCVFNKLI